jgi:serine protease
VGSTDSNTERAFYSNFGARIDVMAPGGDTSINLGGQAQGGGILAPNRNDSANPKTFIWKFLQGTSMAAPHVAGLLALMKSKKPSLTFSEALDVLKRTSVPLAAGACTVTGSTTTGGDGDCGSGLINAQAALQALNTAPTPDFTLSLSPNSLGSAPNQSATITVNITRLNGFNGTVNLSFTDVSGITGSFSPVSVSANSASLTLSIGNVAAKSYALKVTGTSGTITRTADLTVIISANPGGDTPTLQNTLIGACFYDPVVLCDSAKTKELTLSSTQTSAPYQFTNLAAGEYILLGWKDVNNNNDPDEGDYLGVYLENDDIGLVKPSRSGINFPIELVQETPNQAQEGKLLQIAKSLFR